MDGDRQDGGADAPEAGLNVIGSLGASLRRGSAYVTAVEDAQENGATRAYIENLLAPPLLSPQA
jgi:hypothetical protein